MRNNLFNSISTDLENDRTKIIIALFAGIAAGAFLTTLLASKNKFNLVDKLMASSKHAEQSPVKTTSKGTKNDANLPHPEEYGGGMIDVIIQAT